MYTHLQIHVFIHLHACTIAYMGGCLRSAYKNLQRWMASWLGRSWSPLVQGMRQNDPTPQIKYQEWNGIIFDTYNYKDIIHPLYIYIDTHIYVYVICICIYIYTYRYIYLYMCFLCIYIIWSCTFRETERSRSSFWTISSI